ncbi:MAG TPA: 6-bladed beta-propeller [Gemmatimonadaceae bacterium]|nr:6-bladed beta-propeller [Gemmatimonadaceae bacterium]
MARARIALRTMQPAVISAVLLLGACAAGDSPADAIVVRDSAGLVIVENDLQGLDATCRVGAAPNVSIGVAEGAAEEQLYRVFGARRMNDGRIALVNQGSQELRFFDQQGRFVSKTGRRGGGPGEFRDAFHLWVLPGDTIWVGDYRPWRYLVFGPDGEFVRTVVPEPLYVNSPSAMTVLGDGRPVLGRETRDLGGGTRFEPRHIAIVVHRPDGSLADTIGVYPNGRWGQMEDHQSAMFIFPLFESFMHLTSIGDLVAIGHGSAAELSLLAGDSALRVQRIVRWTTADRAISSREIDAERRRIAAPYADMPAADRRRFVDPLVSPERPVADRFPAFNRLIGGRDGRLWVREFPLPSAPARHRWLAFDAAGRFQCAAAMPAFNQVLELGDDYLLVLDRDELGVERVLQYRLGRPGETIDDDARPAER